MSHYYQKPQPNRPRDSHRASKSPTESVSTLCSSDWEDDGRPISGISNAHSESVYSRPYAESVYSQRRNDHRPPPSTYSMPMSNRPAQREYADMIPNPPDTPVSVKYDNGTGHLSPEVQAEMKRRSQMQANVRSSEASDAAMGSSHRGPRSLPPLQTVRAGRPQGFQAPSRHSVAPSVSYASSVHTSREKRYGNQDLPLAPAPLSYSSRKRTAGSGVAGNHPPVPPLPPSKTPVRPSPAEPLNTEFLASPFSAPSAPSSKHPKHASYHLQDLEADTRARAQSHSRQETLRTHTRQPTSQGRHITNSSARPATPSKPQPKGITRDPVLDEPQQSAAVAAGRAMWSNMAAQGTSRPSTPNGRPVWIEDPTGRHLSKLNGRHSPIEGAFLNQGSVRNVEVRSAGSVHDRAKAEQRNLDRERKNLASGMKTHTAPKDSKGVVDGIKKSGGWWQQQSWRYGDGYWEKTEDGKTKAKKEKKQKEEPRVEMAPFEDYRSHRPIEEYPSRQRTQEYAAPRQYEERASQRPAEEDVSRQRSQNHASRRQAEEYVSQRQAEQYASRQRTQEHVSRRQAEEFRTPRPVDEYGSSGRVSNYRQYDSCDERR